MASIRGWLASDQGSNGSDEEAEELRVPDELIESACGVLALKQQPPELPSQLRGVLEDYLLDLSITGCLGTQKDQREVLRKCAEARRRHR